MSEVVVVTSGKGGVGKTTTSANISIGLAMMGYRVVVIDFDVGLRNLDLIMGCERRVVYDLINVISGEGKLSQALIRDKNISGMKGKDGQDLNDNLYILPASQTRDKDKLTEEGVGQIIQELKEMGFDYIVCDSPAGIEHGAKMAMSFADRAIVVTNPEISSVHDSDRVIGLLEQVSYKRKNIKSQSLVTRYNAKRVTQGDMLPLDDIVSILKLDSLGVIPECESVVGSSNSGRPSILNTESPASIAYKDAARRFLGEEIPFKFIDVEKKGIFARMFGSRSK